MGASSSRGVPFDASTDIATLEDKVVLVTGGNSGLGKQSILELSKHEAKVIWLASRNIDKANEAIEQIKDQGGNHQVIKAVELDLTSMESIAKAVATVQAQTPRLDILILNAGIMAFPPERTKDGYEIQFAANYLGHAFLTQLLLPVLLKTAEEHGPSVRVVLLSSVAHHYAPRSGIIFNSLETSAEEMSTVARYGQSKLAVILYGQELAKRYPKIKVAVVHPGQVKTNLGNTVSSSSFIMRALWKLTSAVNGVDPEIGALNQLWAATADAVESGEYYEPVGILNRGSKQTKNRELAQKLWDWTVQELDRYSVPR